MPPTTSAATSRPPRRRREFQAALRDPANGTIARALRGLSGGSTGQLNDTSFLNHGAQVLREPFLTGFAQSMDRVFLVAALVVLPAFLLSFFLKEVKLRQQSGLEAQAAERAASAQAAERASPPGAGRQPGTAGGRAHRAAAVPARAGQGSDAQAASEHAELGGPEPHRLTRDRAT